MAKARGGDFSDILVRDQLVSSDQLAEARSMAESSGTKLQDVLIKLGYVTQDQAIKADAEFNKMDFVDLNGMVIPEEVINIVPESVARDNMIIPLESDGQVLKIAMSDPTNFDLVTKLQFILNREIIAAVANKEQIQELVNKHYGSDDDNAVAQLLKEGFSPERISAVKAMHKALYREDLTLDKAKEQSSCHKNWNEISYPGMRNQPETHQQQLSYHVCKSRKNTQTHWPKITFRQMARKIEYN